MLESKDKDTLLEMAKALGVKANARLKKSDIIDKILETTGHASQPTPPEPGNGARNGAADDTATAPVAAAHASSARSAEASKDSASSTSNKPSATTTDEPLLGADGEPLADWEIELARKGDTHSADADSTDTESADSANASDTSDRSQGRGSQRPDNRRNDRQAEGDRSSHDQRPQRNGDQRDGGARSASSEKQGGQDRSDKQGGQASGNRNQQAGNQQAGSQQGGNQQAGSQQRNDNRNSDNRNNEPGDSNRRRRRRRKNRGGQEGPQGEDVELLDQDPTFESSEPVDVAGYLDIRDEGYGFLRVNGYLPSKDDAYVPLKLARQYGVRKGDHVTGKVRPAGRNEKNPGLLEIYTINGGDPELAKKRPHFESLTALFPDQRLTLEDPSDPANMTARIIDLVSPIGKGQRGIIVSPPKAGKTTVMKQIAKSIELNNPEVELLVLLIDERPEEVTDMRRSVKGEVIASTFDRPSDEHTHVAEMTIAKARRMVEAGKDVVIILDGITRLSRAYNLAAPASGKILSGGIDAGALYPPKKFFGSARNCEEGGSLTILATALVDTNSRMDEAIFEEFKGTGNMELRLDRKVAERRIYPAIDVDASSTRHEELLFDRKQLQQVWKLRRVLSGLAQDGSAAAGLELLIDRLKTFRTNDEFLAEIAKQPSM
jgi:transcription termination factor Rho